MPQTFDWDNPEEIGIQLAEKHPGVDPLTVRFTDLHKWIIELPGFSGDPKLSNEGKLESIQMAWHEEFQDSQQKHIALAGESRPQIRRVLKWKPTCVTPSENISVRVN